VVIAIHGLHRAKLSHKKAQEAQDEIKTSRKVFVQTDPESELFF
jgi:hypothetical protein